MRTFYTTWAWRICLVSWFLMACRAHALPPSAWPNDDVPDGTLSPRVLRDGDVVQGTSDRQSASDVDIDAFRIEGPPGQWVLVTVTPGAQMAAPTSFVLVRQPPYAGIASIERVLATGEQTRAVRLRTDGHPTVLEVRGRSQPSGEPTPYTLTVRAGAPIEVDDHIELRVGFNAWPSTLQPLDTWIDLRPQATAQWYGDADLLAWLVEPGFAYRFDRSVGDGPAHTLDWGRNDTSLSVLPATNVPVGPILRPTVAAGVTYSAYEYVNSGAPFLSAQSVRLVRLPLPATPVPDTQGDAPWSPGQGAQRFTLTAGDSDTIGLTGQVGERFVVRIDRLAGWADARAQVRVLQTQTGQLVQLAQSEPLHEGVDGAVELAFVALLNGPIRVELRMLDGVAPDARLDLRVELTRAALAPDDPEPSSATEPLAPVIAYGQVYRGVLLSRADLDVIRVAHPVTGPLRVSGRVLRTPMSRSANLSVRVGTQYGQSSTGGASAKLSTSIVTVQAMQTGDLAEIALTSLEDDRIEYEVWAEPLWTAGVDDHPDTPEQGTIVQVGAPFTARLDRSDDVDWVRVPMQSGRLYELPYEVPPAPGSPITPVKNGLVYEVPVTGFYPLKLPLQVDARSFVVRDLGPTGDEPSAMRPLLLTESEAVRYTGVYEQPGDIDVIRLPVKRGVLYNLEVNASAVTYWYVVSGPQVGSEPGSATDHIGYVSSEIPSRGPVLYVNAAPAFEPAFLQLLLRNVPPSHPAPPPGPQPYTVTLVPVDSAIDLRDASAAPALAPFDKDFHVLSGPRLLTINARAGYAYQLYSVHDVRVIRDGGWTRGYTVEQDGQVLASSQGFSSGANLHFSALRTGPVRIRTGLEGADTLRVRELGPAVDDIGIADQTTGQLTGERSDLTGAFDYILDRERFEWLVARSGLYVVRLDSAPAQTLSFLCRSCVLGAESRLPRGLRLAASAGDRVELWLGGGIDPEAPWPPPSVPYRLRIFPWRLADIAGADGAPQSDGLRTPEDLLAFVNAFLADDPLADVGSPGEALPDGALTADDIIAFVHDYFAP